MLKKPLVLICTVGVLFSCASEIQITNDENELESRLVVKDESITVDETKTLNTSSVKSGELRVSSVSEVLTLVAEVPSPVVYGDTLQATSLVIRGRYAIVSYNMQGAAYKGAIQVIKFNNIESPKVVSEVIFNTRDINDLTICDSYLYLAMASQDFQGASIGKMKLDNLKKINSDQITEINLESYAANSVRCINEGAVAVTHGSSGGVSILNSDLERQAYIGITTARSIDLWNSNNYAVLSGLNGKINIVQNQVVSSTIEIGGATIPESKSKIEVIDDMALVALNDGGVKLVNLGSASTIFTIAQPTVAGIDTSLTVSNSVSVYKNLVFIANGEAGVYLAKLNNNINENPTSVDILGKLVLGLEQSANEIKYRANKLFVAAGIGGFKILTITGTNHDGDTDNDDEDDDDDD